MLICGVSGKASAYIKACSLYVSSSSSWTRTIGFRITSTAQANHRPGFVMNAPTSENEPRWLRPSKPLLLDGAFDHTDALRWRKSI